MSAPDVPATETWALVVPYVAQPIDMTADSDEPWSASSDPLKQLRPWHQALAHFAASSLERFRKDYQASDYQLNRFAAYVSDFLQTDKPRGGQHVGFARNYLRETHRPIGAIVQQDPVAVAMITVFWSCGHSERVDAATTMPVCPTCGCTQIADVYAPPPRFTGACSGPLVKGR